MQHFPQLAQSQEPAIRRIIKSARLLSFPAHLQVSTQGGICNDYILLVSGSLRVQILTQKGREVVLYHVKPGEGCILTTSCLFSGGTFPAEGFTEQATEILALSSVEFDRALGESPLFRHFVFNNFGQRLAAVISRIEQICSPAIDKYLAEALLKLANGRTMPVVATHQELASEIGTAREVISRHLKCFEGHGWVSLGRGTIQVNSPDILAGLTKNNPN
jgi:CRP/FNR family transcriptional regulator